MRHRRAHLVAPMQAGATALDRGRAIRKQREEQFAAMERGDPLAVFKLDAIATDSWRAVKSGPSRRTRRAAGRPNDQALHSSSSASSPIWYPSAARMVT
jgi:hypothetical protein